MAALGGGQDSVVVSLARPLEASPWVDRLARYGLACRAVVYGLMAAVAALLGLGRWGGEADQQGALAALTRAPAGVAMVVAIAFGFAAIGAWQATLAAGRSSAGVHRAARRVVAAAKAVGYAAWSFGAFAVARRRHGPGNRPEVEWTARVMAHAFGRTVVGAVGAGLVVAGIVLVLKGARGEFDIEIDPERIRAPWGRVFDGLGRVGMVARGLVVGLVGGFVLEAAATFDPNHARGLDGALRSLARGPLGTWALIAVAAGLAAFGLFSGFEARYADT